MMDDMERTVDLPGGAPMSLDTACFSMYSLMSMRTMASSVLNRNAASVFASSVFPTPHEHGQAAAPHTTLHLLSLRAC